VSVLACGAMRANGIVCGRRRQCGDGMRALHSQLLRDVAHQPRNPAASSACCCAQKVWRWLQTTLPPAACFSSKDCAC